MNLRVDPRVLLCGMVFGLAVGAAPSESWAAGSLSVHEGYNLFAAGPGTTFDNLEMVGVPFNTFNVSVAPVPVGNADAIVHRLSDVSVPSIGDTGTTRLELIGLQLQTAAPVDFAGQGLDTYFVTLQSARGGPASFGSLDITFLSLEGGTTSSFFDVFFDIRKGAIDGPIVASDSLSLSAQGTVWGRDPPPGAVSIPGVNFLLNGQDRSEDFWPVTPFQEVNPGGSSYVATTATPEPSTWLLSVTALVIGSAYAHCRHTRNLEPLTRPGRPT